MSARSRLSQKTKFLTFVSVLTICSASVSGRPNRLDLYDASDNHLMFIEFKYDAVGLNTSREVFMSDSTFMRRVVINYNASGERVSEVSYNFNDDTSYVMKYPAGAAKSFTIEDQFKMDQVGGAVNYAAPTDPLRFDLTYQKTGSLAAQVVYEKDAEGNLSKVVVIDGTGAAQYYGLFNVTGVSRPARGSGNAAGARATVLPRGASQLDVSLNLRTASDVRCDLITLSGRHAATLLRGRMDAGHQKRTLRLDGQSLRAVADGVYVFTVSIDGVAVLRSRYLHQSHAAGGVR